MENIQIKKIAEDAALSEADKTDVEGVQVTGDGTPHEIFRITPPDFSSGTYIFSIAGAWQDGTDVAGLTVIAAIRYKKTQTVTLGTLTELHTKEVDTEISGADYSIAADSGDIVVSVIGTVEHIIWQASAISNKSISELL